MSACTANELRRIAEADDRVDEAYRAKYAGSPYLSPMVGDRARSATVRITPRDSE